MSVVENKMSSPILIVGSSVRAAVWSAQQAGIPCLAVDQFGDADLLQIAQSHHFVSADFHELPHVLKSEQVAGWCYTGGLENHSRIIGECAQKIPVWGNGQKVVEAIRDPFALQEVASEAGFPMPELRKVQAGLANAEANDWLMKTARSGGGLTVQPVRFSEAGTTDFSKWNLQNLRDDSYLQRYVEGVPVSVSFLAAAGECVLLGCVEQFTVGGPAIPCSFAYPASMPYLFAGGMTRENFPFHQHTSLKKLGAQLVSTFQLQGLFGVDFICDSTEKLWLLEVNPRYTATMELLERQCGFSFMKLHVDAFSPDFELPQLHDEMVQTDAEKAVIDDESDLYVAKQILYAENPVVIPEDFVTRCQVCEREASNETCFEVVDVPHSGENIPMGNPICTVISRGMTKKICLSKLISGVKQACIVLESEKK